MQNLTVIIPYCDGQTTVERLLNSLPASLPVIVVDDVSRVPYVSTHPHVRAIRLTKKGYFSGAVNAGIQAALPHHDILILNQDVWFENSDWQDFIGNTLSDPGLGLVGERITHHPAWPDGYIQGTFMWMRRRTIEAVGLLNERDYPLWGATAELQLRAARQGFRAVSGLVPGLRHERQRGQPFGSSIAALIEREPHNRALYLRTPPAVSVIITSHSYGRYLSDAVNSLIGGPTSLGPMAAQSFQSFEIIIVDDGSTDETREVGQSLADASRAIRYIRRDKKGGTPAANNTGIREAHGKYIAILCADDMRESDSLEYLYRACEAKPGMFAYDDMTILAGKRGKAWPMGEYDFGRMLYKNNIHAGIMFPKAAWAKAGGYPEIMDEGREDWAFNVALGRVGCCGVHVPKAGYLYRREGQNRSLTNTGPEWRQHFQQQIISLFPDLYGGQELPMGCCGGGKRGASSNGYSSNGKAATMEIPNSPGGDMVLVKYLGGNAGEEQWRGVNSKRTYIFGGSREVGWVERRDLTGTQARPGLLDVRENRRAVFELYTPPTPAAPVPAVVTIVTSDGISQAEAHDVPFGEVVLNQRQSELEAEKELQIVTAGEVGGAEFLDSLAATLPTEETAFIESDEVPGVSEIQVKKKAAPRKKKTTS